MSATRFAIIGTATLLLSACASLPPVDTHGPIAVYHDTRLQYALVTAETTTLSKEFSIKQPPSWPERIVAATVLPITAAAETAFFPFFMGIKTGAPNQLKP
jgi:hypothetical protein